MARRYVTQLPDHSERSRSGMTDEDILQRIEDGTLFVDQTAGTVWSRQRNGRLRELCASWHRSNGSAYRFVEICYRGRKKKIAVHRLVWMFANRRTIPEGHDVDHINGKQIQFPDGIANLRLLESSVNRSRGYVSSGRQLPFVDSGEPF